MSRLPKPAGRETPKVLAASTGYGTRTPVIIISPYARWGVFHQQTTNVSILSFMQHLWGLAPLTPPPATTGSPPPVPVAARAGSPSTWA
jgi:hypothetical protein